MTRAGFSLALIGIVWVSLVVSGCVGRADRQAEPTSVTNVRATVVAEITATAVATRVESATPTPAPILQTPPGSFVSPVPLTSGNIPAPVATSTPRPVKIPTLSSIVEYISPSVVQISASSGTSGSGFIVDADGLILTNAHVVEGSTTVDVEFTSGWSYTGEVLGVDEIADLALVEVDIHEFRTLALRPVTLGDSDEVMVGEDVIAMGFPQVGRLGSAPTITRGIISAKRTLDSEITLFQTDAAIKPGNSGGPLFRPNGEVVGVNTSKMFKSDDGRPLEGIGMAVSANDISDRLNSLARGESVIVETPPGSL